MDRLQSWYSQKKDAWNLWQNTRKLRSLILHDPTVIHFLTNMCNPIATIEEIRTAVQRYNILCLNLMSKTDYLFASSESALNRIMDIMQEYIRTYAFRLIGVMPKSDPVHFMRKCDHCDSYIFNSHDAFDHNHQGTTNIIHEVYCASCNRHFGHPSYYCSHCHKRYYLADHQYDHDYLSIDKWSICLRCAKKSISEWLTPRLEEMASPCASKKNWNVTVINTPLKDIIASAENTICFNVTEVIRIAKQLAHQHHIDFAYLSNKHSTILSFTAFNVEHVITKIIFGQYLTDFDLDNYHWAIHQETILSRTEHVPNQTAEYIRSIFPIHNTITKNDKKYDLLL